MKDLLLPLLHLAVTAAKLCRPGGVRAVIAENLLLKQQLIVLRRSRQRAFALSVVSSVLNLRAQHPILPAKFEDVFDADRYAQSQRYTRSQTMLGLVRRSVSLAAVFAVWQLGGFGWLDRVRCV